MKEMTVDTVVIGAGTAGLAAYRTATAAGRRVVLIERADYGTTCARVGCMPSKLLIAAAEAAHATQRLGAFGLELGAPLCINGAAVMARVRRERDRFVGFVLDGVDRIPAEDRLRGAARFTGPNGLEIDASLRVNFGSAVIATGSSPRIPAFLMPAGDRLIVNDDVFDWNDLPRSIAVFGPGVIGLELGQALHRLGVRVQVFGHGGIGGGLSDPAVRACAEQIFRAEFPLETNAKVHALAAGAEGVSIRWSAPDGGTREEVFDYVLAATGRAPNVGSLGLEQTGIALHGSGVPEFDRDTLQCGSSAIFIAGDANADVPLLHEAADEGRIAGLNAARYPDVQPGQRRSALSVVFSDPQIALVGARYVDIDPAIRVVGEVSFDDQGRSRVMLRNRGLLRIYADARDGRFLGAEMMGPEAEHLAHLLAWAHQAGMSIDTMLEMPFYHPVVEEGLRTALRDTATRLAEARTRNPLAA